MMKKLRRCPMEKEDKNLIHANQFGVFLYHHRGYIICLNKDLKPDD
ncbi:089L [Invertebrate iridescent virus Kaz2018]|uniref:089L n=1 Tax=Invertebrate iridescent virus 6 TaxID=176652 RepID=Q91G25_IIV6|nr:089L [Invertebrate iridescent virus 6]AAK82007.1 089L [Invertebrate iridescent virus 6]QMS79501.1 hypothetical protein IIV6-T1_093 [Invertebrate iridescent virus 6]QNH08499.1 089L [Invertebrate iridescent virus Kaz2018]